MANISMILGGTFYPPIKKIVEAPEIQLIKAILDSGLNAPNSVILDGRLRRFTSGESRNSEKTCWYVGYMDGIPSATFGDWKTGMQTNWRADIGRPLTNTENTENRLRMENARTIRDEEIKKDRILVSSTVQQIWDGMEDAIFEHPYLTRKGINSNGARLTGDGRLALPLYNNAGELTSLQYIGTDGTKRFHTGGATAGCFNKIGTHTGKVIYVAEGFATAATIYEQTGQLVFAAYSASNLPNVVEHIRNIFGASQDVCVVADNDKSGVGLKYADQASAKHGCRVVMPPDKGDANDYKQDGGDLMALLQPSKDGVLTLLNADEMAMSAIAPDYIINNILENDSHGFIIAQSQTFKTFMALHFCHSICTGKSFFGFDVYKKGKVIYVCGEGKGALARRLKGINIEYGTFNNNLLILEQRIGIDSIPDMFELSKLIEENQPVLVIFDTFASLVNETDENSNKEVGAAINLIRKTCSNHNASSMAIHHTGKTGTSARGAYSFLGNGDFLFNMTRKEDSMEVALSCVKMKDGDNFNDINVKAHVVNIGLERQDGTETTTLILKLNENPDEAPQKETKLSVLINTFKRSWVFNGCELNENYPYVTRSGMMDFLIKIEGYKQRTAENKVDPNRKGGFIEELLKSETIFKFQNGWRVTEGVLCSAFVIESKG